MKLQYVSFLTKLESIIDKNQDDTETYENWSNTTKGIWRQFIQNNAYMKKMKRYKINDLTMNHKGLEK